MLFTALFHQRQRPARRCPRRPSRPRLLLEVLEARNLLSGGLHNVNTDTEGAPHAETTIAVNPSNPRNLVIRRAFARAVAPREIEPEQLFYFSDTVKCWPSSATGANRSPNAAENSTCVARHLRRELELVGPRLIIAFGARAAAAVLSSPVKIAAVHAHPVVTNAGLRVIPLMHPSTINIAGMRRVGIRSLDDYEAQLVALLRGEIADALARFDSGSV